MCNIKCTFFDYFKNFKNTYGFIIIRITESIKHQREGMRDV